MIEKINLRAPVLIDGEKVRELTYDTDLVTSDQFIQAEILAANAATRLRMVSTKVVELDAGFHYYLGVMAILAVNPEYAVQDVERIKGPDVLKVMKVGRNFMTADVEGEDGEDSASTEDWEDEQPDEEPEGEDGYPKELE